MNPESDPEAEDDDWDNVEDDDEGAEELSAEWALEDSIIAKGKPLRELNRVIGERTDASQQVERAVVDVEMMQEAQTAHENLILQLDAAIGRGRQIIISKRGQIEQMKGQIRLQREEYTMTHRLLNLELKNIQNVPRWWFILVMVHLVAAFVQINGGSGGSWIVGLVHFALFLAHYRRLYVKAGSATTMMSLAFIVADWFWW